MAGYLPGFRCTQFVPAATCRAIGLIAALVTRETWGRRERAAVDKVIAAGK